MDSENAPHGLNLTELEFWDRYWSAKAGIGQTIVPYRYLFTDILTRLFAIDSARRFLEIGGFPGFYSVWFSKYLSYSSSLVDIYIKPEIVESLTRVNGIAPINTIQSDIFRFEPAEKFDVVMSAGLIEHFTDLPAIIERHRRCLRDGGRLIVCVPNFLGVNGLLQRWVDGENFKAHNLAAMDLEAMRSVLQAQGFKDIRSSYHGGFGVWIEEARCRSKAVRTLLRWINYARIPFNVLRLNTKAFAPYIVYIATK
ncbi:MAG: methyltransferase domain-containing protein [Rhizobacter sp.]